MRKDSYSNGLMQETGNNRARLPGRRTVDLELESGGSIGDGHGATLKSNFIKL